MKFEEFKEICKKIRETHPKCTGLTYNKNDDSVYYRENGKIHKWEEPKEDVKETPSKKEKKECPNQK